MTVRRVNRHRRILQKDNPLIIGGSVQLNRVYSSVQLWTNGCLADVLKVAGRLTGILSENTFGFWCLAQLCGMQDSDVRTTVLSELTYAENPQDNKSFTPFRLVGTENERSTRTRQQA